MPAGETKPVAELPVADVILLGKRLGWLPQALFFPVRDDALREVVNRRDGARRVEDYPDVESTAAIARDEQYAEAHRHQLVMPEHGSSLGHVGVDVVAIVTIDINAEPSRGVVSGRAVQSADVL